MLNEVLVTSETDNHLMPRAGPLLGSVGIFADVPEHVLAVLAQATTSLRLVPDEVLIRAGEPGKDVYVVTDGRLSVSRRENERDIHVGDVLPGECVGETAVVRDAVRTATVTAVEDSTVLEVPGNLVRELMVSDAAFRSAVVAHVDHIDRWTTVRHYRPSAEEVVDHLSRMLPGTSTDLLKALEPQLQWVALPRGTTVMQQGQLGDYLYFVVSGRLSVSAQRDDGSRVPLGDMGPGESVGELALLGNGGARTATVLTTTDCELLRLSKTGFDRLLAHDSAASATLAKMMANRLQERLRARTFVAQLRTLPLVTESDCADVAATGNLILRNLKVTDAYYRLSIGMTLLTGHQDVSWLTFACNASKTVGTFIRAEAIPMGQMVELSRRVAPSSRVANAVRKRLTAAVTEVAELISQGNIKVFSEIGPVFARMTAEFHAARDFDRAAFDRFLQRLALRTGPSDAGGQDTLREAVSLYYDAMFQPDPKRKAELMLLANFKVGLHEQIRLQPHIEGAMNAPVTEGLFDTLGSPLLATAGRESLMRAWRHLATRAVMRYRLPYGAVPVSGDLPRLPTRRTYPDVLSTLDHPELQTIAHEYGTPTGSRLFKSRDWANLDQRMQFIFELFRTRQKSLELFDPPFLHQQRLAIATDQLPTGAL
jgi:CRP-like cAMP-binding protein